jgi:hypothetical protein
VKNDCWRVGGGSGLGHDRKAASATTNVRSECGDRSFAATRRRRDCGRCSIENEMRMRGLLRDRARGQFSEKILGKVFHRGTGRGRSPGRTPNTGANFIEGNSRHAMFHRGTDIPVMGYFLRSPDPNFQKGFMLRSFGDRADFLEAALRRRTFQPLFEPATNFRTYFRNCRIL